jgi:hypothetical protein
MQWINILQKFSDTFLLITFVWLWLSLLLLSIKQSIINKKWKWRWFPASEQLLMKNEIFASKKFKRERAWVGYALMWFVTALMIWGGVSITNAVLT